MSEALYFDTDLNGEQHEVVKVGQAVVNLLKGVVGVDHSEVFVTAYDGGNYCRSDPLWVVVPWYQGNQNVFLFLNGFFNVLVKHKVIEFHRLAGLFSADGQIGAYRIGTERYPHMERVELFKDQAG